MTQWESFKSGAETCYQTSNVLLCNVCSPVVRDGDEAKGADRVNGRDVVLLCSHQLTQRSLAIDVYSSGFFLQLFIF